MPSRYPSRVALSKDTGCLIPVEPIDSAILEIRGQKVMSGYDLATIYGVSTEALSQAVMRNRDRFPEGSQLTDKEKDVHKPEIRMQDAAAQPPASGRTSFYLNSCV